MRGRIASIRLTVYIGLSMLGVTETYRLLLLYLPFIIQVPLLTIILETLMLWILFAGVLIFTLGLIGINRADPPLLSKEEFSYILLPRIYKLGFMLAICLGLLILLPPTTSIVDEFQIFFQMIVSIIWSIYYFLMVLLVLNFYLFYQKETWNTILNNKLISFQILFGIVLSFLWFLNIFTLILSNEFYFIVYMIILVLYLFCQSYFFLRSTRFAYLLHG